MTLRLLASLILSLNVAPLLAQKDMAQAQQYYRQTPPKSARFKVLQQTPKKGGEIKWQGGSQPIEKDGLAQGHVIIDQGPTRLTGDQAIFNLDSKTGTFFNATGNLQGAIYFTG